MLSTLQHLLLSRVFFGIMHYFLGLIIYSEYSIASLTSVSFLQQHVIQSYSHHSNESFISIRLCIIVFSAFKLLLSMFVKLQKFMKWEIRAYFVSHHKEVIRVIKQYSIFKLKKHSSFIFGHVIIQELNGLERKFSEQVINKMSKLFLIVTSNKEYMLYLFHLTKSFQVMIYYWVTRNYFINQRYYPYLEIGDVVQTLKEGKKGLKPLLNDAHEHSCRRYKLHTH